MPYSCQECSWPPTHHSKMRNQFRIQARLNLLDKQASKLVLNLVLIESCRALIRKQSDISKKSEGCGFGLQGCKKMLLMIVCGEGNGTPLQYSCLENPIDEGAW